MTDVNGLDVISCKGGEDGAKGGESCSEGISLVEVLVRDLREALTNKTALVFVDGSLELAPGVSTRQEVGRGPKLEWMVFVQLDPPLPRVAHDTDT